MGQVGQNRLVNPVLRTLLRSRLGRRLGGHLALLRYRGRRTGRMYELPVQYVRQNRRVWIVAGSADRKTWWRNMRKGADISLVLAGQEMHGTATALQGIQNVPRMSGTACWRMPKRCRAPREPSGCPRAPLVIRDADVRRVGRDIVLVCIDLDDRPPPVARATTRPRTNEWVDVLRAQGPAPSSPHRR